MIVISGALVLVAAVLLVLGIVSSITLVYAAIGLSLVSAVFLLVGVFQRPLPATDSVEADEDTRAAPVRMAKPQQKAPPPVQAHEEPEAAPVEQEPDYVDLEETADFPLEAANADYEARSAATGADVLVVSGRPRYHVGGCQYVEGNDDSEPIEIAEARELGFTPCGVCRPNETLALSAAGRAEAEPAAAEAVPAQQPAVTPPAAATVSVPAAVVAPAAAANGNGSHPVADPVTAPEPAVQAAPVSEPVAQVAAPAPPVVPAAPAAPAAAPVAAAPAAAPVAAAAAAPPVAEPVAPTRPRTRARARRPADPVQEPQVQEPAEPEAPAPRARISGRTVLAVAETKEYHRANCGQLTGVDSEELTKGDAIRAGYLACGVCKP